MLLAFMALVNMGFLPHLLLGKHALRSISLSLLTERWSSLPSAFLFSLAAEYVGYLLVSCNRILRSPRDHLFFLPLPG